MTTTAYGWRRTRASFLGSNRAVKGLKRKSMYSTFVLYSLTELAPNNVAPELVWLTKPAPVCLYMHTVHTENPFCTDRRGPRKIPLRRGPPSVCTVLHSTYSTCRLTGAHPRVPHSPNAVGHRSGTLPVQCQQPALPFFLMGLGSPVLFPPLHPTPIHLIPLSLATSPIPPAWPLSPFPTAPRLWTARPTPSRVCRPPSCDGGCGQDPPGPPVPVRWCSRLLSAFSSFYRGPL